MQPDVDFNRRILVIDDQESIHQDFRKVLTPGASSGTASGARAAFFGGDAPADEGPRFEIETASQGEEGVEMLRRAIADGKPFSMAFIDVRMPPGMDGVQTIKALWDLDENLQTVICTAYSDYSFEQIIDELGSTDRLLILKKPFDPAEVRQLANALTEKRSNLERIQQQFEELRFANERARAANHAKSEFLANMSHEIRTPMNAILGYVDLMCDPDATEDERGKYSSTIRGSAEHLLTILNDILDISRIEASRLVINATDFSPFDIAQEVISLMASQASAADLDLKLEVPRPIPEIVESDLVRVRQILLNLVGNAIKFTRKGSIRLVLRLDELEESDHRYLCFDVIDTGIGISEDKQARIFEPFAQADTSSTRQYGGTGLGLTISKRLALLLGGDIEVESRPDVGSTFTLKIYAGELKRAALRSFTPEDCTMERKAANVAHAFAELKARVLLVEDVVLNRRLMSALLAKAGSEVEHAENGLEGLEKALAAERDGNPFDVILMDMQMPVMDGYEATRKLRAAGYGRPVVALTAHAMEGDREKCLDAGCDAFETKPINRERLIRTCYELISADPPGALPSAQEPDTRKAG